jgi:acetolactate synthase regulatory subunit
MQARRASLLSARGFNPERMDRIYRIVKERGFTGFLSYK